MISFFSPYPQLINASASLFFCNRFKRTRVGFSGLKARGDKLPGYAIGGLAGGEEKSAFVKVVSQCTAALPENKPRYVMGVGYPLDLVVGSQMHASQRQTLGTVLIIMRIR